MSRRILSVLCSTCNSFLEPNRLNHPACSPPYHAISHRLAMTQSQAYFSIVCFLKHWSSRTCLESFREMRADQLSPKYPQEGLFIWCWSLITLYFTATFEIKTASTAKACDHCEQPNAQARSGDKQASPSRKILQLLGPSGFLRLHFNRLVWNPGRVLACQKFCFAILGGVCWTANWLANFPICQYLQNRSDFHKRHDVGSQCLASRKAPANP